MTTITNITDEGLFVPALGTSVAAGASVDITADLAAEFAGSKTLSVAAEVPVAPVAPAAPEPAPITSPATPEASTTPTATPGVE